jgi:MarR family protease production transcriptional regulator HPr
VAIVTKEKVTSLRSFKGCEIMDQALLHEMINHWRGMYKVLENDWQNAAKETGVTSADLHLLWILSLEQRAPMSKIAELGLWDISTVAQMVKRLVKKELLITMKDNNDRRISYCELTPLGREKVDESKNYSYKFLDYMKEQERRNSSKTNIVDELRTFQIEFNRHFHGKEFVDWVGKSAKKLP